MPWNGSVRKKWRTASKCCCQISPRQTGEIWRTYRPPPPCPVGWRNRSVHVLYRAETRFQDLSPADRRDALAVAEQNGGYRARLLEKDIWVVAALGILFEVRFAQDLIFKGGTSLLKVYGAIRRFFENVDITCDIRIFASDLVLGTGDEALPPNPSQEKRWTRTTNHIPSFPRLFLVSLSRTRVRGEKG